MKSILNPSKDLLAATEKLRKLDEGNGFLGGFRTFIARGNAVNMAVGVVIGAAFSGIVKALTDKFINPLIGGILGRPNFDHVLEFHIGDALVQPGAILTAIINFLIIALAVYVMVVMPLNRFSKAREELLKKISEAEEAEEAKVADPAVETLTVLKEIKTLLSEKSQK